MKRDIFAKYLKDAGFDVKSSVVVDTDFVAEYKSGKEGPTIAYMCEYDALPEIGHGCGHNMIGAMSCGAGVSLSKVLSEIGGKVIVYGTPAEETNGGKVILAEAGAFDELDADKDYHREKRKATNDQFISKKGIIGKFVGFAPMICLFVGYLIIPLVFIGLSSMGSAFAGLQ